MIERTYREVISSQARPLSGPIALARFAFSHRPSAVWLLVPDAESVVTEKTLGDRTLPESGLASPSNRTFI